MRPAEKQRARLREAIAFKTYEFNAHGVDLNQPYASEAIVPDGSDDPGFDRDPELHHQPSSRPGAKLPHAWITSGTRTLSTLDTVGQGRFTLITGIGGADWVRAAGAQALEIATVVIGPGQEYEDGLFLAALPPGGYSLLIVAEGLEPHRESIDVVADEGLSSQRVWLQPARRAELPVPGTWLFDPPHTAIRFIAKHVGMAHVHGRF